MRLSYLKALALLLLVCTGGLAVDAGADPPLGVSGGLLSVLPGQRPPVSLERLTFRLNLDTSDIQADYVLHNDGPAGLVGFCIPEFSDETSGEAANRLAGLRVWVDGVHVHMIRKRLPAIGRTEHLDDAAVQTAYWAATMPFRRGQQRRVRVSFRSRDYGHEVLNWTVFFPEFGWRGSIRQADLTITSRGAGLCWASLTAMHGGALRFDENRGNTNISLSHRGDHYFYEWKRWHPSNTAMCVTQQE